ncbi:MAG TPA: MOSC domain-containing protein [Ktedonobacteraceae bacterium]|nr:MOSC domain-containing protein [Ktedonobacteraceae bacterium]
MQSRSHVISVNVGLPREVVWKGKTVLTGIFKEPVAGRIPARRLDLDGDRQADLSVHGGPAKAIYVYPAEHYAYWREQFPTMNMPWGMFGENLTVEGLEEKTVHIGDQFRIGTAQVVVTQPRFPCYKLGIKFQRDDMLKRFLQSGLTGFYLAVLEEGEIAAGDPFILLAREEHAVSVSDIINLYTHDKKNLALLRRAVAVKALPDMWRETFSEMIARLT